MAFCLGCEHQHVHVVCLCAIVIVGLQYAWYVDAYAHGFLLIYLGVYFSVTRLKHSASAASVM